MGINIKQDQTDHFALFCPECSKAMTIKEVGTQKTSGTKCTYLHAKCECGFEGQRKIYWDGTCSEFCR
jgi:hypothetical protein